MIIILYILLGLSLGAGTTLIALQERFVRERRRLMALGESQLAKAAQSLEATNKKWEQRCQALSEELAARAVLPGEATETDAPAVPPVDLLALEEEHARLHREMQERDAELSRLTAENLSLAEHLAKHRDEIADLQGQLVLLKGELARAEAGKGAIPDEDFILLGQAGHLLPGSVVRTFIKGRQR